MFYRSGRSAKGKLFSNKPIVKRRISTVVIDLFDLNILSVAHFFINLPFTSIQYDYIFEQQRLDFVTFVFSENYQKFQVLLKSIFLITEQIINKNLNTILYSVLKYKH